MNKGFGSIGTTGKIATDVAPFVVDLDRDLLGGTLGAEMFWSTVGKAPLSLFASKRLPPAARGLPLDPAVVAAMDAAHAAGRPVILTDSGHPGLASGVATRLDCIDSVEPGTAPAHDLPRAHRDTLRALIKQLRPHQWTKNALILLPLLAGHAFQSQALVQTALAFVAMCLIASGVYVLNDLADLDNDRVHRTKRERPFASGRLSLRFGGPMLVALLVAGFAVGGLVSPALMVVLAVYFVMTTAYSMKLKGMIAVDILVLSMLYAVRVIAGATAIEVDLSVWLLTFTIFMFFSLASVKRLSELVELEARDGPKAAAGRAYSIGDLPIIANIATASGFIAVLVLALYLDTPEVRALYSEPWALWGVCLVLLFWVSRIVLLAHRGAVHEDPVVFALKDRTSRVVLLMVTALFATAVLA